MTPIWIIIICINWFVQFVIDVTRHKRARQNSVDGTDWFIRTKIQMVLYLWVKSHTFGRFLNSKSCWPGYLSSINIYQPRVLRDLRGTPSIRHHDRAVRKRRQNQTSETRLWFKHIRSLYRHTTAMTLDLFA